MTEVRAIEGALLEGIRKRAAATSAADQLKSLSIALAVLHDGRDVVDVAIAGAEREAGLAIGRSLLARAQATTAADQLQLLAEALTAVRRVLEPSS